MVWVYGDPPFTKRELKAYASLRRKLKDKEFVDRLIKIISLYNYLRKKNPSTVKEIEESAFFDKAKTKPIFNDNAAKRVLRSLHQKGGESKYPYTDKFVKEVLYNYTPDIVGSPVRSVYGVVTETADALKENVPFADLAISSLHGATEIGVTAAGDIAEGIGGPVGAAVVAPFAGIAAALASGVSTVEGDLGQSVAHLANAVPIIGSLLGKILTRGEGIASKLDKDYEKIMGHFEDVKDVVSSGIDAVSGEGIPSDIQNRIPQSLRNRFSAPAAGKRFSTMRNTHTKWKTTRRRRFATR